jgi:hypothetical protein
VRTEGLCKWKIPMTLSGMELASWHYVTQCLNQLRHRVRCVGMYGRFKLTGLNRTQIRRPICISSWFHIHLTALSVVPKHSYPSPPMVCRPSMCSGSTVSPKSSTWFYLQRNIIQVKSHGSRSMQIPVFALQLANLPCFRTSSHYTAPSSRCKCWFNILGQFWLQIFRILLDGLPSIRVKHGSLIHLFSVLSAPSANFWHLPVWCSEIRNLPLIL